MPFMLHSSWPWQAAPMRMKLFIKALTKTVTRASIRTVVLATLVSLGTLLSFTAYSDDGDWRGLHGEVAAGRLVSLSSVLDWLQAHYHGEVLDVDLERDDDEVSYEIDMIGPQGQLVEFVFDAGSGELIGIEGVNIGGMRR